MPVATDPKTTITGVVQAVVALLSVIGLNVAPDQQDLIIKGWIATHGVLSMIKGLLTKDKK